MKIQTTSGNCLVLMCADAARGRMDVPQKAKASRVNECAGFTVVELLVVIAIIGVLVEMLCPAIQTQRHLNVRRAVESDLVQLVAAANAFHQQNGTFTESLTDLSNFCAAHPEICRLDAQLASSQKNGYFFKLSQPGRSGPPTSGLAPQQIVAGPVYPGITGLDTLVADTNGNLLIFRTPGAEEAQQKVFERIRAKGAETIAGLLRLHRDAPNRARDFVNSAEGRTAAFNAIDGNDDGFVDLAELGNINTSTDLSLSELTTFISDQLKFDRLDWDVVYTTKIDWSGPRDEGPEESILISFDGVVNLTSWYVSDPVTAESLTAKLRAAEAAEARGDAHMKASMLRAYTHQVARLTCTTLTINQAATLAAMARAL
jgi:prepilin-type N-terminal cleavage/methylation domain-containing protein